MKIGTIVKNNWAGEGNPNMYFFYTGIKGRYATGICFNQYKGKLEKVEFYKSDFLKNDNYTHEGKRAFEVVGYCNAFEVMKKGLKKFQEGDGHEF